MNAICLYRCSRWFYLKKIPLIPIFLRALIFVFYNCKIPYQNKIGKKTCLIAKGIGVALTEGVEIGENCRIGINVVCAGKGPYKNLPIIKNNVWLGPGCVVVGPVIIEDNVIIAPNSVVTKSVPKGAIVGGVPAKLIGWASDLNYDILQNQKFKEEYLSYLS